MHRFITSTGHTEPAMIPVRNVERSWWAKPGSASMAMNMVGTPYTPTQRSRSMALRVRPGSNPGAGITMVAPCVVHPRLPMTIPKQ
ncbi:Uncharacterised protein [Mycobacteroides abscessus subsp. abscessus]|nr:Uncharacterised protein [Mycobacteroides abscessus subsp. abscessus]